MRFNTLLKFLPGENICVSDWSHIGRGESLTQVICDNFKVFSHTPEILPKFWQSYFSMTSFQEISAPIVVSVHYLPPKNELVPLKPWLFRFRHERFIRQKTTTNKLRILLAKMRFWTWNLADYEMSIQSQGLQWNSAAIYGWVAVEATNWQLELLCLFFIHVVLHPELTTWCFVAVKCTVVRNSTQTDIYPLRTFWILI